MKRTLALLLACALGLSVLSGCSTSTARELTADPVKLTTDDMMAHDLDAPAVHAAKIEVNEKGTEAAAATVVAAPAGGDTAPEPEGITLILDRPFLYGIVDLQFNVPLFLGTYE